MSYDLRRVLECLKQHPGQLAHLDSPVDSDTEITGLYRHIGAGGTVMRPTKKGPALLCTNIKGFPDTSVLIGLLASRERVGLLLECPPERLGFKLNEALTHPIPPVHRDLMDAPCQEVVRLATDADFDIRKILPAPRNTEDDAGPYITMGLCYATDPETGEKDITIHRLCLQSKDEMTMSFAPGRHLGVFREKAERMGKNLPISISIGVDPAIAIASCFEPPTTPLGYNELSVVGGLRGEAVELVKCKAIDEYAIANAEFIVEGELVCGLKMDEDINTGTGKAMPEFPGYTGVAAKQIPVVKIKAVTYRRNPIIQTCIGSSEEHVNMAGLPTEASIMAMTERALPGLVRNVYAHPAGGGKYMAVMQFHKTTPNDEGRQRQAALAAMTAFIELKHVILVDEDVDIFDSDDVLWALNTRYQGNLDTIMIPGVKFHPLDPSACPEYDQSIRAKGISCKTIFDCTVPFEQKSRFIRSRFREVDVEKYEIIPY